MGRFYVRVAGKEVLPWTLVSSLTEAVGGEITEFMYGGEEVVFSVSTTSSQKTLDAAVRQAVPGAFSVSVVQSSSAESKEEEGSAMAEPTAEFGKEVVPASPGGWWKDQSIQKQLLSLPLTPQGLYVYHLATVKNQCRSILTAMQFAYRQATPSGAAPEEMADKFWSQCQPFYAMKANPHPDLVTAIASHGIGIECVSAAEIRHARRLVGSAHPILFTPNFCDASEYGDAFALGADVTVDGPDILRVIPDTFAGREIGVRIDPGAGEGHHAKVVTAGPKQKFGHPINDMDTFFKECDRIGTRVVGIHAHVGSGILRTGMWSKLADTLLDMIDTYSATGLKHLRWVDLGGGIGIPYKPEQQAIDMLEFAESLVPVLTRFRDRGIQLRMEPGRFLVAQSGVLLSRVTQVRSKGEATFVGSSVGMNGLIRPALYDAYHGIHNLSRLEESSNADELMTCHVVGPICETGDILGMDRQLPRSTAVGDTLLVDAGGAYGIVMASNYNLRPPPLEIVV